MSSDPQNAPPVSGKTFAEFFAGIGLVHAGLRRGGWRCTYANDIEPRKRAMYEAEFGSCPYFHVEDIWKTDEVMRRYTAPAFLVTASFPCVDLSIAGHWRGFKGERSATYFGFIEVIRQLGPERPKLVMLENVSGFLTANNGADFRRAVIGLAELDYWIDAIVLDAKWFVPQSRPRAFVIGFHESMRTSLLARREDEFMDQGPWLDAIERTASIRPAPLRGLYDRIELPTGWAAPICDPPSLHKYRLIDFVDLDSEQD